MSYLAAKMQTLCGFTYIEGNVSEQEVPSVSLKRRNSEDLKVPELKLSLTCTVGVPARKYEGLRGKVD